MSTVNLPEQAVDLDVAKKWIANWQDDKEVDRASVKAYLIPHQDIADIQQEQGWDNYRAYNGITEEGEFKLLIVGVNAEGNDLVDYNTGDYVYDMTTPCPSVCSLNVWWE